ncbi:MAG TPA: hypothetical protein VMR50_03030 [Myxococcota bacterium]|nr:hypothetical protein [Myxococcota bacterium]
MRLSVLAAVLSLAAASAAPAATQSYRLNGRVTGVRGAAENALKGLGVKKDALVQIHWTVELSTPVHDTNPAVNSTNYWATNASNGITAFTVQIGSWTATGVDPAPPSTFLPVNVVGITGPSALEGPGDRMDLSRSAMDTNGLINLDDANFAEIVINLSAPAGGASTSNALGDQTPSKYLASTGYVVGSGGEVDFAIPGPDATQKCRASQLASAATLCQSSLKCLAAHAKAPDKDPMGTKRDACLDKARTKFVAAFDKAAAGAASRGLGCGTEEDGAALDADFDSAQAHVVAIADAVQPPDAPVLSSWYSGGASMCSTGLKAESKDASKPTPGKVERVREDARIKLTVAAGKAVDAAQKKGVTFDPAPDVAGLVESIDLLIDDLANAINGAD